MARRIPAAPQTVRALDRLSVTIMVTANEYAALKALASQPGLSMPQYVRTRCGFRVRQTSLPNTEDRDSEEDDAWDRLQRLGLDPQQYFGK